MLKHRLIPTLEICNGLLFRSILRMCVQNLKFVALPIPEIIGGIAKKLGSPWIRPCSLFSQIFNGLLFAWALWIYLPNLKFVALPVPEIIGVLKKFGQSLDTLLDTSDSHRGYEFANRIPPVQLSNSLGDTLIRAILIPSGALGPPRWRSLISNTKGVEAWRRGKWGGVLSCPLRALGSAVSSPSGQKRFLYIFNLKEHVWWQHFCARVPGVTPFSILFTHVWFIQESCFVKLMCRQKTGPQNFTIFSGVVEYTQKPSCLAKQSS